MPVLADTYGKWPSARPKCRPGHLLNGRLAFWEDGIADDLPTFQAFADFCAREQGYARDDVAGAVRWRIGLACYSFVREVYTIAVLRCAGLDVRAHPLADALFRVDAWAGRTVLSLYVRNAAFRDGQRGRKPRASQILGGAEPPFHYQELSLDNRHEYGCVHLPEAGQIRALAARI
jgi:hypothetical protein